MNPEIKVGVIGDFNPANDSLRATNEAVHHAADSLTTTASVTWIPTEALEHAAADAALQTFDALWCAPASPYKSMAGALAGIRYARESGRPFVGT